jgi:hypothetical protein
LILRDLRNRADFLLRSHLRWGRKIDAQKAARLDAPLQADFEAFLARFDWRDALAPFAPGQRLNVADVGCRTFLFAPVLERHLQALGFRATLHGIELDAYRRFTDLRTRADYGHFYAASVEAGHFHARDVLDFRTELDIIFLLDPFVALDPLLSWGLPRSHFAPARIFAHLRTLLSPGRAVLVTSNPSEDERDITRALAEAEGFRCREEHRWEPTPPSPATRRLGMRWVLSGAC